MARENISITMPESTLREIESRITGTESRSGWISEACERRLDQDQADETTAETVEA